MNTKFWSVDNNNPLKHSYPQIQEAANLLKQDEVIAFPTETVYGLGANALSIRLYVRFFKQRDVPLTTH